VPVTGARARTAATVARARTELAQMVTHWCMVAVDEPEATMAEREEEEVSRSEVRESALMPAQTCGNGYRKIEGRAKEEGEGKKTVRRGVGEEMEREEKRMK
jgi:hypothetical protein